MPSEEGDAVRRALVVFESMFGNGHRVADLVAAGLRDAGFEATVCRVADAPSAPDVELLVMGGPTHALGMSRSATRASRGTHVATHDDRARAAGEPDADKGPGIREYLRRLSIRPGLAVGVYDTRVNTTVPAGASRGMARRVTALGGDLLTSAQGFPVAGVTGPLCDGVEARARAWGGQLAAAVDRRAQETRSESPTASRS